MINPAHPSTYAKTKLKLAILSWILGASQILLQSIALISILPKTLTLLNHLRPSKITALKGILYMW